MYTRGILMNSPYNAIRTEPTERYFEIVNEGIIENSLDEVIKAYLNA